MTELKIGNQSGFVLITSLVVMGLLSLMSIGLYASNKMNQDASRTDVQATQAYYYAETALNYVFWALENDGELDGEDPNNPPPPNPLGINYADLGDWTELTGNAFIPGPTTVTGVDGQVRYFDNRPITPAHYADPSTFPSSFLFIPGTPPEPDFSNLVMPQHLVIEIDSTGSVSLGTPHLSDTATPLNGAAVWLRAVDRDSTNTIADGADMAIVWDAGASQYSVNPDSFEAVSDYDVAAYALAFVDGKPMRLVRVVFGVISI